MRVFLDANVLFSAAKSDGAIRELLGILVSSGHRLVADVYVLEEARRLGLDLGDAQVLERYEKWRALDSIMVMGATDTLTRIFGVPGKTASAVRRFGMAGVQRSGWLKKFFMDEARGVSGDVPELMKA